MSSGVHDNCTGSPLSRNPSTGHAAKVDLPRAITGGDQVRQVVRCVDCRREFDPRHSLLGDEGQCQECWERYCDESWWSEMQSLEARFYEPQRKAMEHRIPLEVREDIAAFLLAAGRRPCCSTGIGGETTRGYGRLDEYGYWEYPLLDA